MQEDMEVDEMDSTSTIAATCTSARTAKTKWDTLCDAGLLIVCAVMDHLTCDAYTAVKTMCNKFVKECGIASAEPTYEDLCTESNLCDIQYYLRNVYFDAACRLPSLRTTTTIPHSLAPVRVAKGAQRMEMPTGRKKFHLAGMNY